MPKETWAIASVLTILLLLVLLGYASWGKKREVDQFQAQLAAAADHAAKSEAEIADLKDKLAQSQAQIEQLRQEKDTALQTRKSLEDEMRSALESKDVTISKLQGKLTVNILDRIMFDSGEAELKPGGAAVLRKVAGILAEHPELKIHVIGHTDNVPIRASARHRFPSNWELSTARATAAVRFLTEVAGVDPRRLGRSGLWRVSSHRRQYHGRRPRPQPPHRDHHSVRRDGGCGYSAGRRFATHSPAPRRAFGDE